jgi:hypothetical protein
MLLVQFDRPYACYNAGERATVTPEVARHLVERRIASAVEPPSSTAPEASAVLSPAEASTPAPAKGKKA